MVAATDMVPLNLDNELRSSCNPLRVIYNPPHKVDFAIGPLVQRAAA